MRGNWPIRVKVFICLGLLLLVVTLLSSAGLYASNAYRNLVRDLRTQVEELPAGELSRQVADLRITLARLRERKTYDLRFTGDRAASDNLFSYRHEYREGLNEVEETLRGYGDSLEQRLQNGSLSVDNQKERQTVEEIRRILGQIDRANQDEAWMMLDLVKLDDLETQLDRLQELAAELPSDLHKKLEGLHRQRRLQYRTLIVGTWITGTVAALTLALLVKLFFGWVFRPLQTLIAGSRRVGGGEFDYRIRLDTNDEMAELAEAMNNMTARFQAIHNDLENQVKERTRQVIRSEQLASVGFLAAGVAHEINNPLASIALCAESLESRVREALDHDEEQHAIIGNYLKMIETEAFRCKEITEKLLDFSRLEGTRRQNTDLGQLVQDVIDMLGHLGKYQGKHIEFTADQAVVAPVNAQEIKQVVLNLLANALDSIDDDGAVRVEVSQRRGFAELTLRDDGCGMEPDVLQHIFEPFFTRRRSGQGTGLGLSITYRIIAEHDGEIEAQSPGRGKGSTFRVRLPLSEAGKEQDHRHQAA
ncbi:MAG: HAMP domain-containing histidine kinase [Pirellulales bacterium]|nr:HAMP domain-containing histidine kinase [Pirellulales bacterium]